MFHTRFYQNKIVKEDFIILEDEEARFPFFFQ